MNKHILRNALIFLTICIVVTATAFYIINKSQPRSLSGTPVFATTVNNGLKLDKVILTTPKSTTILEIKNNFWLVTSGSDYYGNLVLINQFLTNINKSTFYSSLPATEENLNRFGLNPQALRENTKNVGTIQTYAAGKLMNEIRIGYRSDNGLQTYAYIPGSENIWLITGTFTLPRYQYSWFQQPVLNYPASGIKAILSLQNDEKTMVLRLDNRSPFINQKKEKRDLEMLTEEFNYMIFTDVKKISDFQPELYPEHRTYKITMFSGLVTTLDLYSDGKQYWAQIKLSASSLTTGNIDAYIDSNKFLYDGWIFELPPLTGKILFTTEL